MHISGIKVHNYKSFYDSGRIHFEPGINIISGQNNSGKTALLEALSTRFDNHPHRSLEHIEIGTKSKIEISLSFERDELFQTIIQNRRRVLIPKGHTNTDKEMQKAADSISEVLNNLKLEINFTFPYQETDLDEFISKSGDNLNALSFHSCQPKYPPDKQTSSVEGETKKHFGLWDFRFRELEGNFQIVPNSNSAALLTETTGFKLIDKLRGNIYRFHAERMNIGICEFGTNEELNSNASNLAEVLNNLQGNPEKLREFNTYVSEVLPYIKCVSVRSKSNNEVEILVWPIDASTKRIDLASPLSACGTGVSQVLSILYVLLTSSEPRTIIIDEPQSFLHPGAVKKLIGLLKQFSQHQYFISTHSPSVISAANPSTITLLRYQDGQTISESISSNEINDLRGLLDEVGVRLSDIYGADSILWVEGPTEELCFPLILNQIHETSVLGIQILAIKNTGDLSAKNSDVIFDVYNKVSGGAFLFPPTIGFVLDREDRSDKDIKDLERRGIYFINRRMYENYLIDANAIAKIINKHDEFRDSRLEVEDIESWIASKKIAREYLPRKSSNNRWLGEVDAAKLLKDLFNDLSETRVDFKKTQHSFELTQWLIENKPEALDEIKELLVDITQTKERASEQGQTDI